MNVDASDEESLLPDLPAPESIDYRPQTPKRLDVPIGLIGCGAITRHHLQAYRDANLKVVALCDLNLQAARERQKEFYPQAMVTDDYQQLLKDPNIEVVDISTHPEHRPPLIAAALEAGKHVLSQKPFVLDLDQGERLVEQAQRCGVVLAVNQNGRWAPHFSYARQAVAAGLIGQPFAAHMSGHWDHRWVAGTPFEKIKHLVLYDYAIHWFDMLHCLLPGCQPLRVFASTTPSPGQGHLPNLLAQALIEWDQAQSTLAFDAALPHGPSERTFVSGSAGSIHSDGPGNNQQHLLLTTADRSYQPPLVGRWFPDGFRGTMCELLCSLEERRACSISAADNLLSLALCFAAIESAATGEPVKPGQVRRLPG
jgi:predicted dehydrogenase